MEISSLLGIIVAISLGLTITYYKLRNLNSSLIKQQLADNELAIANAKLTSDLEYTNLALQRLEQQLASLTMTNNQLDAETKLLQQQNLSLVADNSRLKLENEHLTKAYDQLEVMLAALKEQLTKEFSTLKTNALNELSQKADNSLKVIGKENVVGPLQEQFKELQLKINELAIETKVINRASQELHTQAKNLALALTKDSKKKGDFGEMVLANILESVGLSKHLCYLEQAQITLNDKKLIPDVIIKLPHNRAVIVDSKNIMSSYYQNILEQEENTKAILSALKITLKNLSSKDYLIAVKQQLASLVFDYAIMFIPNEGLFSLILEEDQRLNGSLLKEAYQQKIFIAGPSTLLVLLGIIERSWEVYQIEERAESILNLANELIDKFKLSLQRLNDLGLSLRQCGNKYDDVIKSLDNGTASSAMAKLEKLAKTATSKINFAKLTMADEIIPRLPHSL